jgi:hypothetical protein
MTKETEVVEDEEIEAEALEEEVVEEEAPEEVVAESEEESEEEPAEEEEIVLTIEGEEEDDEKPDDSNIIKDIRRRYREAQKKIKELERNQQQEQTKTTIGAKPTLEGMDYDSDKYEAALEKWYEDKRKADEEKAKQDEEAKAQKEAWDNRVSEYEEEKKTIRVNDYEDAEFLVQEMLSVTQQGIILQGAQSPAKVIYAIGKSPKLAKELQAITDPVKFAFRVAQLEPKIAMTTKKPPAPEKVVSSSGGASISGAVDSTLERLRAKAEKTGDYTKVAEYKRKKRKTA